MSSPKKSIQVVPYDPAWPEIFEAEAALIKKALKENCQNIHHVGSTSVPDLAAKPKIDIIAVVRDPETSIPSLENAGYVYSGEWNIPFKYGFVKRGDLNVNLHVYEEGHPEIELNLLFRDYMRKHPTACEEYTHLKYRLLEDEASFEKNDSIFTGYTLGKEAFIRKILKQVGFNRLRLLRCTHHIEWEEYHRIRDENLFAPRQMVYDRNHPSLTSDTNFHFVLYQGTEIVCVAQIEFLNDTEAALRTIATDTPFRNQGYASHMVKLLEKWIKSKGRNILKTHAALDAEGFYRKMGFTEMTFNDPSISKDIINLGKVL